LESLLTVRHQYSLSRAFPLVLLKKLTNTLQKKLDEVRQEKSLLEKQIDREHRANAVLQTQLSDLRNNHLSVAEALEEEDEMEEEG